MVALAQSLPALLADLLECLLVEFGGGWDG